MSKTFVIHFYHGQQLLGTESFPDKVAQLKGLGAAVKKYPTADAWHWDLAHPTLVH